MSGSLDIQGFIQDWPSIEGYLFNDASTGTSSSTSDDNDWNWEDEEEGQGQGVVSPSPASAVVSPTGKSGKTWIQDCVIAVSPMADVLVVCRKEKAVFLTSEWDSRNNRTKYCKFFEGNLSQEGETITSALCIPLISNKKSSPGAPDWTCVVLGFSDGYVRMYTESGSILIGQMFHDEAVTALKCHSYKAASAQNEHDQLEEIFIMYQTVLVTIDGFGLFQTLRGCRSRIARVQANAAEANDPPPLSYKKWQYDAGGVTDCESIGVQTPTTFDHLLAASVIGGITAKPGKVPYTTNVFATVGSKPYVSFHYAQEGQAPFKIGKLAFSVANRLTSGLLSAASGWLGFGGGGNAPAANQSGQASSKPEKPKIEAATAMAGRFGLPDTGRNGKSIIISPCHKLSAVTDSLGRVVLLDNERGIAVRMWKGYRDAQCAWLAVNDDMNSKTRVSGRKALFLVIYSPRKGMLEIFSMQQGPKVASFPVSKSGSLIGLSYSMMGLNNVPVKGANQQALPCLFLDPEGQLYQLHIPFHLALNDSNNSKLKDMHLLKTLQRMLRDSQPSVDEICGVIYDIKTQSMANQAFKILIQYCNQYDVMNSVVEAYLEKFCENERQDLTVAFKIQSLLQLYSYLVKSMDVPPAYSSLGESSSSDNTVLMCLHATQKEIKLVKDMANKELFNKSSPTKGVSFADEKSVLNVNDFLTLFRIEYDPAKIKLAAMSNQNKLELNLKNDNLPNLGKLVFCGCFNSNSDLKEWQKLLKNCDLIPLELMMEVLKFWCSNALSSSSFIAMMSRLYLVTRAVCDLEGTASTINVSSAWWDAIRKEIAQGHKTFYNYTFAIVCRAVTIDLNHEVDKNDENTKNKNEKAGRNEEPETLEASSEMEIDCADEEGWENVSLDLIRWNILLKQIEDLSFLSTILAQKPELTHPSLPQLRSTIGELSVIYLLEKGTGCIADLVGSWLTTIGVDPAVILDGSDSEGIVAEMQQVSPEYTEKEMKQKQKLEPKPVVEKGEKMEIDEETRLEDATNVGSEVSYIQELLRCLKDNFTVSLNSSIILCNYCWEYCIAWNQDVNNVAYLQAAIRCAAVVPSSFIKQGLMSMMWSTFMSKQLENIVARGRVKREKLLEKASVINNAESRNGFLNACVKFLDDFMENNVLCQGVQPPIKPSKKSHWSMDTSVTASLSELALTQPLANYEMILLHYQLSLTALFVHNFGIRKASMKPMNLFDTKACMMFFTAIHNPAPYSNEVDLALKVLREEFLCLVVTNVIGKIPEELNSSGEEEGDQTESYISPSLCGVRECESWIQKIFELGRVWTLDLDSMRINQVCEYFSSGFDLLGVESIGAVNGKDILGSKLLVVAGMRFHYYILSNRESTTEIVSNLTPNLSNWLNKLDYSKLRCLRFPKSSISELSQHIISLIPESSYDYKLAEDLQMCSSFLTSS